MVSTGMSWNGIYSLNWQLLSFVKSRTQRGHRQTVLSLIGWNMTRSSFDLKLCCTCHRKPPQQSPTARGGMAFWRLMANHWRCWSQPPSSTRWVLIGGDEVQAAFDMCWTVSALFCPCSFWSLCCCWGRSASLALTSESEWRGVDVSHKSMVCFPNYQLNSSCIYL